MQGLLLGAIICRKGVIFRGEFIKDWVGEVWEEAEEGGLGT